MEEKRIKVSDKNVNKGDRYYSLKSAISLPRGCSRITMSHLRVEWANDYKGKVSVTLFMESGRSLSFDFESSIGSSTMHPYDLTRTFSSSYGKRDSIVRMQFRDQDNILLNPKEEWEFDCLFPPESIRSSDKRSICVCWGYDCWCWNHWKYSQVSCDVEKLYIL